MFISTCHYLHVNFLDELSPRRRLLLWAAVLSGLLLAMLDQTIVGTALPAVVRDLGDESWYVWGITAYLVPATVLLPVCARLSDRFGRQRVLLSGMAVFVLGSALSAAAQTMPELAGCRAVQGGGAAALEALSFLLVAELSGPRRNVAAQAVLAGIMAFSFIAGPLIGGLLTDHAGWRWIFLVNVPLGVFALVVVSRVLPPELGRTEDRRTPLDVKGIATLGAAVGLVLVGLGQHLQVRSWTAPRTGGLVLLGLVGLVVLVLVERRAAAPVLPPRLLTGRVTGRLLAAGVTATFGLYACVMLMPRYYQQVQGVSATRSGVLVYPLLLGVLLAVNLAATLIIRWQAYRGVLLTANATVLAAALGFSTFGPSSPGWLPLLLMTVLGLGLGPALSGLQVAVQRTVTPQDLAAAMGTLLLGRQIGGAVALALAETVYAGRLDADASAAAATGWSLCVVAAAGAVIAALALMGVPRGTASRASGTQDAVPATSRS
jgi:EmrB/QacA subfamily drug resistance transporter